MSDPQSHPDFSSSTELEKMVPNFVTTKNWLFFSQESDCGGFEYVDATNHVVTLVERIMELGLSFEETKEQLFALCLERRTFIKHAEMSPR